MITNTQKVKKGQVWIDKKTGDKMTIGTKQHDIFWNCVFERNPNKNHKMPEFTIKKYYTLL